MARVVSTVVSACRQLVQALPHGAAAHSEEYLREVAEKVRCASADLRENRLTRGFDQDGRKMWFDWDTVLCQPLTTWKGLPVGVAFQMQNHAGRMAVRDAVNFAGGMTNTGFNTVRVRGGELLLTPWNEQTRYVTVPVAPRANWHRGQAMVQLFVGNEMRRVNVTPDVFGRVLWKKYLADQVQDGQDGIVVPVKHLVGLLEIPEGPDAVGHYQDLSYDDIAGVLYGRGTGLRASWHHNTGHWAMDEPAGEGARQQAENTAALVVDPDSAQRGHDGDPVYFRSRYAPGSPGDVMH